MNTLNRIMRGKEVGTVIVKSYDATKNTFIPLFYYPDKDYWIGYIIGKYRYFMKWRKGDNPVWDVVGECDPLEKDHPIIQYILNLKYAISMNYKIYKHQPYDCVKITKIREYAENKIRREKEY